MCLLRLAHMTDDDEFRQSAERSLRWFAPKLQAQPTMAPQMLAALGRSLAEPEQIVLRCAKLDAQVERSLAAHRRNFAPNASVLALDDAAAERLKTTAPFLAGLERKDGITLYECRNFVCELPKAIA